MQQRCDKIMTCKCMAHLCGSINLSENFALSELPSLSSGKVLQHTNIFYHNIFLPSQQSPGRNCLLGELTVPQENIRNIHAIHILLHLITYYYYKYPPLDPLRTASISNCIKSVFCLNCCFSPGIQIYNFYALLLSAVHDAFHVYLL